MITLDEAEENVYRILNADTRLKRLLSDGGKISRKIKPLNSTKKELVVVGIAGGERIGALQRFIINVNCHTPLVSTPQGLFVDSLSQKNIMDRVQKVLKNHFEAQFNVWTGNQDNHINNVESISTLQINFKYISKKY